MCFPLPVIGAVLGLVQAGVSMAASSADASAKAEQWKQNQINALAASRDEQRQLTLRQIQEQDATTQKVGASRVDEAQRTAEAEVSAADAGLSGVSLDAITREIGNRAAQNRTNAFENYRMTAEQLQAQKDASVTKAKGRIDSIATPTDTSFATGIVGLGQAGVKLYGAIQNM